MSWPEVSVIQISDSLSSERHVLLIKCSETTKDEPIPERLEVKLTNLKMTYEATISKTMLDTMASNSRMEQNEFYKLTVRALTTESEQFTYEAKDDGSGVNLSWKYKPSEDVKFQLGSVDLSLVDNEESLLSTLKQLGTHIKILSDRNDKLNEEKRELEKEREGLTQFLEKKVAEKDELELKMYAKFVRVLNEKKKKYRENKETASKKRTNDVNEKNGKKSKKDVVEKIKIKPNAGDLDPELLNDSLEDAIPEPSQVKRKIVSKKQEDDESHKKLRSPPPPPFNESSDTDADSDDLLSKI